MHELECGANAKNDRHANDAVVKVSICCVTYNHAAYIGQALDGFVAQIADFRYEILIHDDCSTDGTREIIEEYASRYPELIVPVYEEENQWGKVNGYLVSFLLPLAKGEYIALCEGDDYWTDPLKLQKQVDVLEKRSEVSLCVHRELLLCGEDLLGRDSILGALPCETKDYSPEEVMSGGGSLFPTASMVFRKEHLGCLPQWLRDAPVADYPLAIWLSLRGTVRYIPDTMCVYRYLAPGSWTANQQKSRDASVGIKIIQMLEEINRETGGRYTAGAFSAIERQIASIYTKRDIPSLTSDVVERHLPGVSIFLRLRIGLVVVLAKFGLTIERRDGSLGLHRL